MLRHISSAVVLAMFVLASPLPAQEAVTLRLNVPRGTVVKYTTQTDQQVETNFMGFASAFRQQHGIGTRQETTQVDANGNMTIGVTYEWVTMKSDNPQAMVDYDSRTHQGEVPLMAAGMSGMVGQKFEMVLSPLGKVVEMRGLNEMLDRVMENSKLPPELEPIIRQTLKAQFSEEMMKASIEGSTAIYPEKAVKPGDIWHGTSVIPMINSVIEANHTLKSLQGGNATVEMKATIDPTADPQELNLGVATLKMQLTGTQSGTTVIDQKTGLLKSSDAAFDMQGEMIVNNPAAGQELKIPTSIKGTMKVTTEK